MQRRVFAERPEQGRPHVREVYLQAVDPMRTNQLLMLPFLRSATLIAVVLFGSVVEAQQLIPTRGKEFWMGFMRNYDGAQRQDLFISSDVNTSGVVSAPLFGWSEPFTVTANTVTTIEVPLGLMNNQSEVIDNKGVHIESEDTVAVYALSFQNATADATVIYPVKSTGTDYRVQAYRGFPDIPSYSSEFLVVATADSTEIEITATANTVGGHAAGAPWTIQLNAGESYQVQAQIDAGDLTGSTVRATAESGACRPFSVYGGSVCPQVPAGCAACDHVYEQNLPTPFWGSNYYSVPWEDTYAYTYRILAHTNGTSVTVDNDPPIVLSAGQVVEVNGTDVPHCFTGNQPFSVAQFMQGSDCSGQSDPAMLLLNAQEQKINDITFATVVSNAITAHYINVVVDASDVGTVVLDGNTVPAIQFNPFPACADRYYAALDLDPGSHRISCPNGLTGYVYGTGPNYETYAYSVGSFTPLPALNYDTAFCGLDTSDTVTLSPPDPVFNPVWTTQSSPDDTLSTDLVYTFQPNASDVYVITGTENISGCVQQYFFSVELGDPPTTNINAPPSICAYTPVQLDLQLTPSGTYNYQWTPAAGLDNDNAQDPVATPAHDTWYYVNVTTITGCAATSDSVLVTVTDGDVLNVSATSDPLLVCLGESAQLDVAVRQIIAEDDFDAGIGTIWEQVSGAQANAICGSVVGDALRFNDAGTRVARTVPLDVSAGGALRFALKICNGTAPCDDVDPGENIYVEYTINGSSWVIMATYTEAMFPDFTSVVLDIPLAAQTDATQFRWRQLLNSGSDQDNWVLDDVAIAADDATNITFNWSPPGTLSNASIADPVATPLSTQVYTVNLIDQTTGCAYQDEVTLNVGPPFTLEVTNDTAVCGLGLGLQLEADPVEPGSYTWQWGPDDGSLLSIFSQSTAAFPFQTTDYIVEVTSQFGCVITDTVTVRVVETMSTDIFATPNPICEGQEAQLQVQAFQGSGNYGYVWTPPASLDDGMIAMPIATPTVTTVYTVTVTDLLCGAIQISSIEVEVLPAPPLDLGPDQPICPDQQVTLDAGAAQGYLWSTSATTATITVDTPDTYWVEAVNGACTATDSIVLSATPDPGELGFTVYGCEARTATLTIPYANGTYLWATGDTTQSITVGLLGDYPFTLIDQSGCTYNDIAVLVVDPLAGGIDVPNVISPNGDGKNERFEPLSGGNKDVAVVIYNRFGQEVFNAPNMNTLWRGDKDGSPVPDGTYFYVVRYKAACEAQTREQKGAVTVVR